MEEQGKKYIAQKHETQCNLSLIYKFRYTCIKVAKCVICRDASRYMCLGKVHFNILGLGQSLYTFPRPQLQRTYISLDEKSIRPIVILPHSCPHHLVCTVYLRYNLPLEFLI